MLKIIENLPADVLGIEASGKVTHEDYQDVLIPAAEEMMKEYAPIKFLYILNPDFEGFELGAMWDDSAFGLKHWHDFSHIAFVTDHAWMKGTVAVFVPLMPGEVHLFDLAERDEAIEWISAAEKKQRAVM